MILKSFELSKIKLGSYKFYLFYGDNDGLKEEIIKNLFEKNYPDKIQRYEEKEILDNVNNFFNSALTKSFFDNEKLVIINRATDKIKAIIEDLMEKNPEDIQIILNSKNLEKKSNLRKFFENEKSIISVPFYEDNNQTLNSIASLFFRNKKIPISQQLINVLIERSRGDRKNLNNELEKMENFSLNKKNLNIEEIIKLTNLADNYSASELVDHLLAKNTRKTITILNENNYSDEDNIVIIRTLLAKLKRLVKIYELVDEKNNIEKTIAAFKPTIFWKDKPLVTQQIKSWEKKHLKNLIYKTNEIELLVKKNSVLAKNLLADFIIDNSKKTNN
jgi:DNA polymerase III subunit delta